MRGRKEMARDLSFANGYADDRQALLLSIGLQIGFGRPAAFMMPYHAGYESGRSDDTLFVVPTLLGQCR